MAFRTARFTPRYFHSNRYSDDLLRLWDLSAEADRAGFLDAVPIEWLNAAVSRRTARARKSLGPPKTEE